MKLDHGTFDGWLRAYGEAWVQRDPSAVTELFTPDAIYYWTPLEEPKRGREQIAEAWRQATSRQEEIRFGYEILALTRNKGIARWWCSLTRRANQRRVRLDGILIAMITPEGLCDLFQEWWHSDEERN